jgi:hypothetical protein
VKVDRKNSERSAFLERDFRRKTPLEWEFIVMEAGELTKDEQVRFAARTTVCLFFYFFVFLFLRTSLTIVIITGYGLHGNGLTHLQWRGGGGGQTYNGHRDLLSSSDSLMIITGLLELWESLITLFGMIRELCSFFC